MKRCHLQVIPWKAAHQTKPPDVDVRDFRWTISDDGLQPVTGIGNIDPPELLKVIACNCSSDKPCSRATCSCRGNTVSCTGYCQCEAHEQCHNSYTVGHVASDNEGGGEL